MLICIHNVHCYPGTPSLVKDIFQANKVTATHVIKHTFLNLGPWPSLFYEPMRYTDNYAKNGKGGHPNILI